MDTPERPGFLEWLDSDPDRAFTDFYRLTNTLLNRKPPRALLAVPGDERQDVIHDVVFKLTRNDFRLLRRYEDRGRPFRTWLYAIASHTCIDHYRRRRNRPDTARLASDEDGWDLLDLVTSPNPGPDKQLELAGALAIVRRSINDLGRRCQLLLQMAADGFTPRQMVTTLRLDSGQNKKVSDDLRYCRRQLVDRLVSEGFDPKQLAGVVA